MSAMIWCPFPDRAAADRVAGRLLDEKLIACANFMDGVTSLYTWNGERGAGEECGALFKTDARVLAEAVARLEELHPYDTPAVMGWRCDVVGSGTGEWLASETAQD